LRALFGLAPTPAAAGRWLWISRSDAQTRHLTWEDELRGHFPRFEKIVLSRLSPAEQIRLFATAAVVAGPHGAGFAQLAFCPAGGRFVEIFPQGYRQPIYARLAQTAGLDAAWAMVNFSQSALLPSLATSMTGFLGTPA
jgi:capsular polysaccharide biosynthesis protein